MASGRLLGPTLFPTYNLSEFPVEAVSGDQLLTDIGRIEEG